MELEKLLKKPTTLRELSINMGESRTVVKFKIRELIKEGYNVAEEKKRGTTYYYINKTPVRTDNPYNIKNLTKFGAMGDTHCGSRYSEEESLNMYYKLIRKLGIKTVFHAGDITDGVDVYPGHINDLKVWGVNEQAEYVADNYPKIPGVKTYFICLTPDHKVLVKNKGFVGYNKVKIGDYVLSIKRDKSNKKLKSEWSKVTDKQVLNYEGKMYEINSPIIKTAVTPDHFMLISPTRTYKKLRFEQASEAFKRSNFSVPMAGEINRKDYNISDDEIKILAWFISEGSWLKGRGIQIYQNDITEIEMIVKRLGYKYSIYKGNANDRVIYIYKENIQLFKDYAKPKLNIQKVIDNFSVRQMKLFLEEYIKGDGHKQSNKSFVIYTKSKELAEQFAILNVMVGYRTKIRKRVRHTWGKEFEQYEIEGYKDDIATISKNKYSIFTYKGKVFDLTVENENFLVMKDGTIYFTGNCGNHDLKAFNRTGVDVGKLISSYRKDLIYLGQYYRRLNINNVLLDIVHPDGGGVYSLSYPMQKYLRNSPPNTHPDILMMGHLHTMMFAKVQGVYGYNVGCFQGTTEFLRRKGIRSDIGGWVIDLKSKNSNILSIDHKWIDGNHF